MSWARIRPMGVLTSLVTAPIRFYQRFLSPLKPPMCRFEPTCSQYAIEALETHGLFRGTRLAVWRLLRCQPFAAERPRPRPAAPPPIREPVQGDRFPMTRPRRAAASVAVLALFAPTAAAQDWREAERGALENHVQLTTSARFRKAGECYFSPDGRQIVFQAIERRDDPEQEERFYQMYVADLVADGGRVTGIDRVVRLSPPGSSNTCGWFHPTEPGVVIFGSTVVPPSNPDKTGYQRESSRYSWQFPQEMDIVRCAAWREADGTAATLGAHRGCGSPRPIWPSV